jgi:hypothetical protein
MADRAEIERQIREVLKTETRATFLSNKLFGQFTGLFSQLAANEAERRVVSQSDLFKEAQARLRELQHRDAEALAKAVTVVREELPDTDFTLRLDTTSAPK